VPVFALHAAVILALVTLSITPVGALFTQGMLALVRTARGVYAHGLFVATTLLSVILTPLATQVMNVLYRADVHVNPLTVTKVAVGELLLPLGTRLVIGRYFPAARRWSPGIQRASGRLFLCLVGFTVLARSPRSFVDGDIAARTAPSWWVS
jgi:bile acid:Na+ symporter, BASS family